MAMPLKEHFARWKHLKPGGFTAGLQARIPVERNVAMRGLSRVGKDFPALTEPQFNEEKKRFILSNAEADTRKQVLFRLTDYNRFEFAWGELVEFDFESEMKKFFASIEDGFELYPIGVELIDLKFYVVSEWEGHHYKAIWEALLSNTPLSGLFKPDHVLQDDLFLRGMLDECRICAVGVESNVTDREIFSRGFENDLLRVYVGVAQTRGIPFDARMADVFVEHSRVAINFMEKKFIPYVLEPLDKALIKLSEAA